MALSALLWFMGRSFALTSVKTLAGEGRTGSGTPERLGEEVQVVPGNHPLAVPDKELEDLEDLRLDRNLFVSALSWNMVGSSECSPNR